MQSTAQGVTVPDLHGIPPRTEAPQVQDQQPESNASDFEHTETVFRNPLRSRIESSLSMLDADYSKLLTSQQEYIEEAKRSKQVIRILEQERQNQAQLLDTAMKERHKAMEERDKAMDERDKAMEERKDIIQERDDARKDASHHCLKHKELQANLLRLEKFFQEGHIYAQSLRIPPNLGPDSS